MSMRTHDAGLSLTVRQAEIPDLPREPAGQCCRCGGGFELIVIAASAGGVSAIGEVLSALPADFPIPVAVVLHRTSRPPNLLEKILARRTRLTVKEAKQSEPMRPGTVYLAPPDLHLIVNDGAFALADGRKICQVLSSANPLFASAAEALGGRVIAVVLTGNGRDATDGVQTIKAHGGTVIAQDEATSDYFGMPRSAIETECVDRILPLQAIGPALVDLVAGPSGRTFAHEGEGRIR